jgi:Bacterial CdiA-CT RNAse A domain
MQNPSAAASHEAASGEVADFIVARRMGSFTDLEAANRLVGATLLRNRERVDRVAEGKSSREEVDAIFEQPTGKEAFAPDERTDPRIRQTYGVRVVIVADQRTWRGYHVITAFPRNFDPLPAPSRFAMDVYRSGGVEVTYDWRTPENFAQVTGFLKKLVGDPTSPDPNNPEKPRFYYFENRRENDALDDFILTLRSRAL